MIGACVVVCLFNEDWHRAPGFAVMMICVYPCLMNTSCVLAILTPLPKCKASSVRADAPSLRFVSQKRAVINLCLLFEARARCVPSFAHDQAALRMQVKISNAWLGQQYAAYCAHQVHAWPALHKRSVHTFDMLICYVIFFRSHSEKDISPAVRTTDERQRCD